MSIESTLRRKEIIFRLILKWNFHFVKARSHDYVIRAPTGAGLARSVFSWAGHDQTSNWSGSERTGKRMNRRANDTQTNARTSKRTNEWTNIKESEHRMSGQTSEQTYLIMLCQEKRGRVQPSQFQSRHVPTLAIEASKSVIPPVGRGCRRSKASTLQYHAMTYFEEAIGEWANMRMNKSKVTKGPKQTSTNARREKRCERALRLWRGRSKSTASGSKTCPWGQQIPTESRETMQWYIVNM